MPDGKYVKNNFIIGMIESDVSKSRFERDILTRFPPEPNGFLHIGHAKSICLNFGIADLYESSCNLRFDDTNPEKEDQAYVDAIKKDIEWLGFKWADTPFHASDYFDRFYECATDLIKKSHAYVCDQTPEEMSRDRGTLKEPGKPSPYRERTIDESLDLFEKMRQGEFANATKTLRAKIDMSSGNINMRDPAMYRIKHTPHQNTGDKWCIYPMYDFAHCLSDMFEGITHSLCSLEFQDHRPLYEWYLEKLGFKRPPQQIEFSRLNLNYTVMSKRKLLGLVESDAVAGWDDPRMPTISGMRNRGYPAAAIRGFCKDIGVSKQDSVIEYSLLEEYVRDELNASVQRRMAILDPLEIEITNFSELESELNGPNHPQKDLGTRNLPFDSKIFIERSDFMLDPPKKFFRLTTDKEVRLRNSYVIRCTEAIVGADGTVQKLIATADPQTLGKNPSDGRKVKGVLHWVSAIRNTTAKVTAYDRLFKEEFPGKLQQEELNGAMNPDSKIDLGSIPCEKELSNAKVGEVFQFERQGYFKRSDSDELEFIKVVSLKDAWK